MLMRLTSLVSTLTSLKEHIISIDLIGYKIHLASRYSNWKYIFLKIFRKYFYGSKHDIYSKLINMIIRNKIHLK